MVCDHVGMLFFPSLTTPMIYLRYIGRWAYPIFAFFIAEGCRYTKNRARYLGTTTALGLVFHLVYSTATGDNMVIVSFALATGMIYLWQNATYLVKNKKYVLSVVALLLFGIYVYFCYALCQKVHVDYLFFGITLPWLTYLFKNKWLRLFFFAPGICLVAYGMREYMDIELWALVAVPIMALYNGKRGALKMKFFFYVFYPAHLVLLYGISLLVYGLI